MVERDIARVEKAPEVEERELKKGSDCWCGNILGIHEVSLLE